MKRTAGILGLVIAVTGGCAEGPPPEADAWPVVTTTVAALSSFAVADTAISITGRVVRQDADRLLLSDGTGSVWVRMPKPKPLPEEQDVLVRGVVLPSRTALEVWALEWAFDGEAGAAPERKVAPASGR